MTDNSTLGPCPKCRSTIPLQLMHGTSKLVCMLWCVNVKCGHSELVDITADLLRRGEGSKQAMEAAQGGGT